ncbi:hypothetical protein BDP27DRAFT_1367832 [Rhodocollybia butyracea]|uniref:Uncharacterized protein n=1 Tax=Rhodocollybia butyracea TaxID=206335 RepID=A0A9P5PHU1_9AGAR|nr:hypothetical protein BDP27DRAFT_1367832 [Rhodocollybia butyracea]
MANLSDEPDLMLNAFITAETPLKPNEIEWKSLDFADEPSLWDFLRRIALAFEQYFVTGKEASQFNPTEWRKPSSKLAAVLVKVMSTIQLENDPVLAERYTSHRWSCSIATELLRYTPEVAYLDRPLILREQISNITDLKLLEIISNTVPFMACPETMFLFCSQAYFLTLWKELLVPAFRATGTELEYPADMETVYRKLCSLCALHKIPDQVKLENPMLHSVMERTTSYKKIIKGLGNDNCALGRDHCDYCDHQPMDLHCKRYILVTERDTEGLEKKLLHTFKDQNEIPLGQTKVMDNIHIDNLPAPGIEHHIRARTNLDSRCGRDITIFVNRANGEEIGGVLFDSLIPHYFDIMEQNHRHFRTQIVNIKRGEAFQKVDWGSMGGGGFCRPNGGARGSYYGGAYPLGRSKGEVVLTKEAADCFVDNWFRMAITVNQASPQIGQKIKSAAVEAGTLPVGRYGLNQYYCYDFVAPLHYDLDRTFTMSTTITKCGDSHHYNFCYAKWGIIVYTQANCQRQSLKLKIGDLMETNFMVHFHQVVRLLHELKLMVLFRMDL